MIHNDPTLWAEYSHLAKQADALRLKAGELANRPGFPALLSAKAGILAYHLRQAYNEALQLAGDKPEEAKDLPAAGAGA